MEKLQGKKQRPNDSKCKLSLSKFRRLDKKSRRLTSGFLASVAKLVFLLDMPDFWTKEEHVFLINKGFWRGLLVR